MGLYLLHPYLPAISLDALMAYALFFYNYLLTIFTVVSCAGFAVLWVRQRRHLHFFAMCLFGLYLADITILWMTETIPQFANLFYTAQAERAWVYTLFSTMILLAYRCILGDLLDYPVSSHEMALWVLCFAGIIAESEVKSDLYHVTVDLVFTTVLRVWTAGSGLWIYLRQRHLVEAKRANAALFFIFVFVTLEAADYSFKPMGARSLPLEIMGFIVTTCGLLYLASKVRAESKRVDEMRLLAFAQRHELTRRE